MRYKNRTAFLNTVISGTQNQLAWLTYHLDESDGELEEEDVGTKTGKVVSTPSGTRSNVDTPNTAMKKVEEYEEQ